MRETDKTLFIKKACSDIILVQVYVDDICRDLDQDCRQGSEKYKFNRKGVATIICYGKLWKNYKKDKISFAIQR